MTNSFLIGEVLNNLLTNNEELVNIIDNKVFPIVATEGTTFPFIVYERLNDSSNGCKDGYYEDTVTFSITILTETYLQGIQIAQLVRGILERRKTTTEALVIHDCHVTSASEKYQDNTYTQIINFTAKIN